MNLLIEIGQFLRDNDIKPTRFGREAVNDPRFYFDLQNGRTPRASTVEKVRQFMNTAPAVVA